MKKRPIILLFLLLVPLLTAHCRRAQTDDNRQAKNTAIRQVELTKEDIVYLYKVPADEFIKVEWNLPKPAYVRMVFEKKLPTENTWKTYRTLAERFATDRYTLYYHLKWNASPGTDVESSSWHMQGHRKLGIPGNSLIRSFGDSFPLPAPHNAAESQVPPTLTPDWIVTFGNRNLQYRLRLEQSGTPYPDGI